MRIVRILIFCVSFLFCHSLAAQFLVKGKVIGSDDGLPLPQVTILLAGNQEGMITDSNGEFEVYVSVGDTLTFRFLGYLTRNVLIRDGSDLTVMLKPEGTFHDYGYNRLHFYAGREVINGMFGGKISYVSELIGMRALEPSISYYVNDNRSFTEARLKLLSPLYPDKLLNTSAIIQYQHLDFSLHNSFESFMLSLQPSLPYLDGNLGLGLIEFGETGKTWGLLLGLSTKLKIAEFRYLPLAASATLWNRNFQFNILTKYRIHRRYQIEIGYQYFNGVGLCQINLGSSIRLWRMPNFGYDDDL